MRDDYLKLCDQNWSYLTIILDQSQDVFWITNEDYSVQIYVNQAFERIWGYESQMLYENPLFWLDTIVLEDKLQLASISRLPHSSVQSYYQERYRILSAKGEIHYIQDYTYPVFNHLGQCIGYAGIAKDITKVLLLEREFEIANKFLPKLAAKMERSAFWVRDPSLQNQLYISKGFEVIWQRPVQFLMDNPQCWIDTIVEEDRHGDVGSMLSILDRKGQDAKYLYFYRIRRPSGEVRWIKDTSFPIFDETTGVCIGFTGIAEDITQEKLYEIELQLAKETAETANIAKSNFIASVSHDFRTPLNGLLGMAEILRSEKCYPEQREYINAILQASNTLLELVEDVINFVALDLNKLPLNREWFCLEKLLNEIVLTTSPQANEKKIDLILNYSNQAPKKVWGDANRIRRIMMNLINNAIKFTNKGRIVVRVELQKQSKRKFWLEITVEDTGIGISAENFDYIFGSFNRVDPSYKGRYKGTGLGLTIVRQFIDDLDGKIKVASQLGKGSIFSCFLPFKQGKVEEVAKVDHYTTAKTLLIDDNSKRASAFIAQFGLKNADFINGDQALNLIKAAAKQEPYQLILIDDEIDYELAKLAKAILAESPCILILLAEKQAPATLKQLKKKDFADCIIKPFQPLVVNYILENAFLDEFMLAKSKNKKINKRKKILLVEDDALTQKITSWMLDELNCTVELVSTGEEALKRLDKKYDLIITDIGLPDMDGIDLVKQIRKDYLQHAKTPVVALTAHVLEKDKEKCMAAGMNDFLKKPLFLKDLKKLFLKFFG